MPRPVRLIELSWGRKQREKQNKTKQNKQFCEWESIGHKDFTPFLGTIDPIGLT
jgi:hypothetical protein